MKNVSRFVLLALAGVSSVSFAAIGSSHTDFVTLAQETMCQEKPVSTECNLKDAHGFIDFHDYLSCLNIVSPAKSCTEADCTLPAPRIELVGIATRVRNVPLPKNYTCQNMFPDVVGKNIPTWTCEIAERAAQSGFVSSDRDLFEPLRPTTRSEAYAVLMESVCINTSGESISDFPDNDDIDAWQKKVILGAMRRGLTTRNEINFEPNKALTMQELYVLSSRIVEWSHNNATCPPIDAKYICQK